MQEASDTIPRSLQTLEFGDVQIEGKHIFTFPDGLIGFSDHKEFILISEEATAPFRWLLSVSNPAIGFPLLSPWHVDFGYSPDYKYDIDTCSVFVIVTLSDEQKQTTANMKAPIILNVQTQLGTQIILSGEQYSTSHIIQETAVHTFDTTVPTTSRKLRKVFTAQFGSIEVSESHVIRFNEGLLGFSNLRDFVIISDEETVPFKWLVSLEQPSIGFPMLSPWMLDEQYDLRDAFNPAYSSAFVIVTLGNSMTANMKAPIIINVENQSGEQKILSSDRYIPTFAINSKNK